MKLSATKWLSFWTSLTSKDGVSTTQNAASTNNIALNSSTATPRQTTTVSNLQPRSIYSTVIYGGGPIVVTLENGWIGTYTVPVGALTKTETVTGTDYDVVFIPPGAPATSVTIVGTPIQGVPASLTVVGTPLMTAPASITESALTEVSCFDKATCTPTPTDVTFNWPSGTSGVITTTMQSYSCTAGETCVGTPYRTELTCNCGGKTCSTVIPLLPIPLIVGPPLDIAPPVPIDPPELSGSSSASACSATTISIPDDFLSTLSYWEAQFPFTLPTSTTSSTITSTSQSKVTTTAAFSSDTSAAQAFSSSLTSESASRASSVAAAEATQKCQHWEAQSYSDDIPQEWWPPISESDKGYLCMAEPSKMDVNNYTWGENWRYQHFSVDNGWDEDHPDVTLVEHFCQTLVDNSVDVTYDGSTQGACAPYGRGDCLREENGQCGMYQHNVAAANGATVVFAVTYKTNSAKCGDEHNKPTYYPDMGVDACVKKLNEHLIDKCKFTKKPKSYNLYELFPVLEGVFWDGCMQYWIVATKNPPEGVWPFGP